MVGARAFKNVDFEGSDLEDDDAGPSTASLQAAADGDVADFDADDDAVEDVDSAFVVEPAPVQPPPAREPVMDGPTPFGVNVGMNKTEEARPAIDRKVIQVATELQLFEEKRIDSKSIWTLLAGMGISPVVPGKSYLWYKSSDKPDQGSWLYVTAAHVELSAKPGFPVILAMGLDREDVTVKVCGLLHDPGMQAGKSYRQGSDLTFHKCASVVTVDGKIAAEYVMDEGELVGMVGSAGFGRDCFKFEGKPK